MKIICFLYSHLRLSCFFRRSSVCARNIEGNTANQQWRIVSSICVQRFPRLIRAQTPLEKKYHELQVSIRIRKSRLSDFELDEKEYIGKKIAREKKALEEDLNASEVAMMEKEAIFEELQESRDIELQSFEPQQKSDSQNDLQSLDRKLDEMLYLLVKKPREKFSWQFPQGGVENGESLVETADRELNEECGDEMTVHFMSNSPFAYHSYNHKVIQNNQIGTKVFFFKAQYVSGTIKLNPNELEEFVWVTRDEMKDYVSCDYYNVIAPTLFH